MPRCSPSYFDTEVVTTKTHLGGGATGGTHRRILRGVTPRIFENFFAQNALKRLKSARKV